MLTRVSNLLTELIVRAGSRVLCSAMHNASANCQLAQDHAGPSEDEVHSGDWLARRKRVISVMDVDEWGPDFQVRSAWGSHAARAT